MNARITPKTIVQDLLQQHPEVIKVFVRHQMDCPGCWLQRFCTLEDVSVSFALSLNTLLEEIQQEIPPAKRSEE
jgi:hybrid cluster-associated redox disulfide protein